MQSSPIERLYVLVYDTKLTAGGTIPYGILNCIDMPLLCLRDVGCAMIVKIRSRWGWNADG